MYKYYLFVIVVFDGYLVCLIVKDIVYIGCIYGINFLKVDFFEEMLCKMKKDNFFVNIINK